MQTSYIPSVHHSFNIELAKKLGSPELAILAHHFLYWITYNKRAGKNQKEGRTWMYSTQKDIQTHFPYWSVPQIKRLIKRLEDLNIIIKGNYNISSYDKTTWYAFENEEEWGISNITKDGSNSPSGQKEGSKDVVHKDNNMTDQIVHGGIHMVSGEIQIGSSISKHTQPQSETNALKDTVITRGRGVVRLPETMALKKSESETVVAPRRYKLNEDQQETYRWLKKEGVDSTDATLCYWAKTHSLLRLAEVMQEARSRKAKNVGAYMNRILRHGSTVNTGRAEQNLQFAKEYKESTKWDYLQIHQKYVSYRVGDFKETIRLDMDPMEFARHLISKYEGTQGPRKNSPTSLASFNPADYD